MNIWATCVTLALLLAACRGGEHNDDQSPVLSNRTSSPVSEQVFEVTFYNPSSIVITFPEENLLGYPVAKPSISLLVFRAGAQIAPCAHVDPPPRVAQHSLEPMQVFRRSVYVEQVRRTYCLGPGKYQALLEYAGSDDETLRSEVTEFEVGNRLPTVPEKSRPL